MDILDKYIWPLVLLLLGMFIVFIAKTEIRKKITDSKGFFFSLSGLKVFLGGRSEKISSNEKKANVFKIYHTGVLHSLRTFANLLDNPPSNAAIIKSGPNADAFCLQAARAMSALIGIPVEKLRCCLKVFPDEANEQVQVWARSVRPGAGKRSEPRLVTNNSAWSALLKRDDGKINWNGNFEFTCFSCPDVNKRTEVFQSDATHQYRSVMMFMCRFDPTPGRPVELGFLQFDSPEPEVFPGVPDIFDFIKKNGRSGIVNANDAEYRRLLERTEAFHLGASIADTAGLALQTFYEELLKINGANRAITPAAYLRRTEEN